MLPSNAIYAPLLFFFILSGFGCHSGQAPKRNSTNADRTLDSVHIKNRVAQYYQGKRLFESYCNKCHFSPEKKMTDDLLFDRLFEKLPAPSDAYFLNFIKDSKSLRSSGDKYAIAIHNQFNPSYDHRFKDSLSEKDLSDLLVYFEVATKEKGRH